MEIQRRRSLSIGNPNLCDLRIVLLGENESENSRVGNLILGIDIHESEEPKASQKNCLTNSGTVKDRHITVIDTLHLLKPSVSDHQITQTVRECVYLSDPGPHAFILVLQCNDFAEEDMRRVKYVLEEFSDEAIKRTIVLTPDEEAHTSIHQFIKECGGGHLLLEKEHPELQSDVFKRVDKILKENLNEYLTCAIAHDVKVTSVDEEQSGSQEEKKKRSYDNEDGKPGGQKKRSEGNRFFNIRRQSLQRNRPNMSANFSGKQKLNLVLIGSDTQLTVSVSKILRGKKIKPSHQRESSEVCVNKEKIHGRLLSVVELPALNRLSEEEVMHQTLRCVSLCDPGVHVFLHIIPDAPLNNDERAEIDKIHKIFDSREHFMILFTTEKAKAGKSVTDFVKRSPEFQSLISRYGGQSRVMGLKDSENSRKIPELLDYIENMKTEPYSLQIYVKAQESRARHELEKKYIEERSEMEDKIKELQEKVQSEGAEGESNDQKCLRIVLIGRTGNGKSATGNTILGRNQFESHSRPDLVTAVCQKGIGEIDGRSVAVVDTPGLFNTTLQTDQVVKEIMKCVSLSSPGPHVFLIVLSLGRLTKEKMDTMDLIKKIFGPKATQFSIVLFTRGDELENVSIEGYVKRSNSTDLRKLIRDCGNRFLVFNNNEKRDRTQVNQLLNMIEELKSTNEGRYFTNTMFEDAEMSIKKRTEEILNERVGEIQTQREDLQDKYEREMKDMMKRLEEEKHQLRENEKKLREEFEEKEKTEQKKREIENQKRSEEEEQQRAEYHQKLEEMKRRQKQKHENEIKDMMRKHQDEARKQAEEFHESTERKLKHVLELTEMLRASKTT